MNWTIKYRAHRGLKGWVRGLAALVVCLALFLFFQLTIPYHFYHREQTSLFLWAWSDWMPWLMAPGALAEWMGRCLTQFYYYELMGPLIVALLLTTWGAGVLTLTKSYLKRWSWLLAAALLLWEAGRCCVLSYPLSGTMALTGWVWSLCGLRALWRRRSDHPLLSALLLFLLLIGSGLAWGSGSWHVMSGRPDRALERTLAIDCDYYFGRHQRLYPLLEEEQREGNVQMAAYYSYLLHASEGTLPQHLIAHYRAGEKGLFLPVDPSSSYFTIYAANEVWFSLGDYTMAEHAAMLGMIFSPSHRSGRALKRLADINLIQGDEAAAMKYLRMLTHTIPYRRWARQRMTNSRTEAVELWLTQRRKALPAGDTLRLGNDIPTSLRHLLQSTQSDYLRQMQLDYLLCYDLMRKDVRGFGRDYLAYCGAKTPTGIYAEGMMIYLSMEPEAIQNPQVAGWQLDERQLAQFRDYTERYKAGQGMDSELQTRYGDTYWFYFHFAQRKGGNDEN